MYDKRFSPASENFRNLVISKQKGAVLYRGVSIRQHMFWYLTYFWGKKCLRFNTGKLYISYVSPYNFCNYTSHPPANRTQKYPSPDWALSNFKLWIFQNIFKNLKPLKLTLNVNSCCWRWKERKFQIVQFKKCDASRSTFHISFIPTIQMLTTPSKN